MLWYNFVEIYQYSVYNYPMDNRAIQVDSTIIICNIESRYYKSGELFPEYANSLHICGDIDSFGRLRQVNYLKYLPETYIHYDIASIVIGSLDMSFSNKCVIPNFYFEINDLDLSYSEIDSLPDGIHIYGDLNLYGTYITELPRDRMYVGGRIYVSYNNKKLIQFLEDSKYYRQLVVVM